MKVIISIGRIFQALLTIVVSAVKNLGNTLGIATLATGMLAYWATDGRPLNSALFVYTAAAWVIWTVLRWGFSYFQK